MIILIILIMSLNITAEQYSPKSFVIRGPGTRQYKTLLLENGGKFNQRLNGGPGYIFSLKSYPAVENLLKQIGAGQIPPTDEVTQEQLHHSKISYYVYQPKVNQGLSIIIGPNRVSYIVKDVQARENNTNVIDNVYIYKDDSPEEISLLQIVNGAWQVRGFIDPHQIEFDEPPPQQSFGIPTVSIPQSGPQNYGQGPSNYGQGQSNYGQGPPNYGQGQSNYGQGPPNYGQGPPNYGQPQSGPPTMPTHIHQGSNNVTY